MSKIYLVERTDDDLGYDEYHNFVVIAATPTAARELCMEKSAGEGEEVWLKSKVTKIGDTKDHTPRVVLGDFNAG